MTGDEMRRIRTQLLKLTQKQLGEQLGVAENTVARYERGELNINEPVARLTRTIAAAARKK